VPVVMFDLEDKRNLDPRSFFNLGRYVMSSSKLFLLLNKAHLNSGVRLFSGIVLCYSHHACYSLHYLGEITSNSGIHVYL